MIGNKADLPLDLKEADMEIAEKFAVENGMIWMEVSAKSGENINKLFENIAYEVIRFRDN